MPDAQLLEFGAVGIDDYEHAVRGRAHTGGRLDDGRVLTLAADGEVVLVDDPDSGFGMHTGANIEGIAGRRGIDGGLDGGVVGATVRANGQGCGLGGQGTQHGQGCASQSTCQGASPRWGNRRKLHCWGSPIMR